MPASHTEVYVHFVWSTWDRRPVINEQVRQRVYDCIRAKCIELNCMLVEIGGTEDHVHVLVRLHATVSAAGFAKEVKGASSHLVTHAIDPSLGFKWQGSYGASSVSADAVSSVSDYIRNQQEHHSHSTTWPDFEKTSE